MASPVHHLEMTVSDLARSRDFYRRVLTALGWGEPKPGMWLEDGCEIYLKQGLAGVGPGYGPRHLCLRAASRDEIDRLGTALRAAGTTVLRGPQAMPRYGATYYTLDVRAPDGFVLEVAHEGTGRAAGDAPATSAASRAAPGSP